MLAVPVNVPKTSGPLLEVQDLHKLFELRRWGLLRVGYVRAVDGVSFSLQRGEAVAVVGESGCGKSTLARTILGLHPATSGRIRFDGQDVVGGDGKKAQHQTKWFRAQIGFVQQDPYGALPPFMNIRSIMEEPLRIHGKGSQAERMARIRQVLTEVKLTPVEDYLGKFPHMLSGGQQQKVVIARALLLEPKLIIADEPVSMLDASVRMEILQLLDGLRRSHDLSLIFITHDLSTVRYFADRIMVMYGGKLVEVAPTEDLLRQPKHPYTQALMAAIPDPDPANVDVMRAVPPGEPPSLLRPPSGCRFHPRCQHAIKGLCDVEIPPDYSVGPDHHATCWLYR